MSEWKQHTIQQTVVAFFRPGWLGVWDHAKSVLTGKEPMMIAKPITLSFYTKSDTALTHVQMETK